MDKYILLVLVGLPAVAGVLLAAWRGMKVELVRWVTLGATLLTAVLSIFLFVLFREGDPERFSLNLQWIETSVIHIRFHLGVDGIAMLMVALTGILTPLAVLCSWHSVKKDLKAFFVSLLFLETGMLGVFVAKDLFLFYVFWEASLIPMYLMIGVWGGPNRIYAAVKFILYTAFASLLMLVAVLYCYGQVGSFDIATLQNELPGATKGAQGWLFAAFALAFAVKVPLFPFHTWLPDAHTEAPTAGSVILAGVLLKMGGYGFLRFAIPFFPEAAQDFAPWMIGLSVVGIIYGSFMAMAQTDIKRLIAYSSVAHMGFVMLGIFSFDAVAMNGAVLQMVNHGISTGALFLLVGIIYEKTHTRGIEDFGGLAKPMPVYAAMFLIVTLSSIGLPGTNGFVGEFTILLGTFQVSPWGAALAGTGVILGAVYMLRLYRMMFFGKVNRGIYREMGDASKLDVVTLAPLILLIFVIGVFAAFFMDVSKDAVESLLKHVHNAG